MKKLKKLAAVLLAGVMMCTALTGCSIGNTAFKYGDIKVSMPEAVLYAQVQQCVAENQYGSYFGENMWSSKIQEGVTMEESVKKDTIDQIKIVKVFAAHADDYKVSLTEDEKKAVEEQAKAFAEGEIGKKAMEKAGADEELVSAMYEENAIANKVQQAIIDKVDTKVTDEEAKVSTVYKLVFAIKKTDADGKEVTLSEAEQKKQETKAKKAYRALKKGADITALAQQYDITDGAEESFSAGKSLGGETFEKAVAKLKKGEFTPVIKDDEGYVIAKLTTAMDEDKTEENKETVLQERQNQAVKDQYNKWTKDLEKDWDYEKDVNKKYREDLTFTFGEFTSTESSTTATTTGK